MTAEPRTTGWPPGMLQDDHRGFSKWLAERATRRDVDLIVHHIPLEQKPGEWDNWKPARDVA
jgi:hypothetical protein